MFAWSASSTGALFVLGLRYAEGNFPQKTTRKYAPFDLTFTDKWEDREVELSLRFAKPTKMEIKRLQDVAGKNPTQAARNLLLATIHPDDKERLTEALEEYPGIATTFSTALIRAVGIAADLGN